VTSGALSPAFGAAPPSARHGEMPASKPSALAITMGSKCGFMVIVLWFALLKSLGRGLEYRVRGVVSNR
jgi:hypothetical protein